MAKIDPSKLTVDFKSLMRLSMTDRYALAQSSQGQSYLASLTPTQFAMLFPDYYRQRLPDMGISSRKGAPAPSGAGSSPSGGTPSSGASTYTPPTAAPSTTTPTPKAQPQKGTEAKPSWQKRIEDILSANKTEPNKIASSARISTGGLIGGATIPKNLDSEAISTLNQVASRHGLKPEAISMMINLESGWNTRNKTGSYFGLTQMGPSTFREAKNGRLGGLTWDEYKNASPAQQINAYGDWLSHYKFGEKLNKHKINLSSMSASMQAAYLQGMQFAPNADGWKREFARGNYDVRTTPSQQARALGSTSISDMARYYDRIQTKNPPQYEKASTATPGDPSKTGTTEQTPLRPKTITADPRQLEQLNRERKHFYSGKLTMEGIEYTYGSGGRKAGSMPYGTFDITGLHRKSQYRFFENNSFYVKDMFDPKVGRNRVGMLIHSQTDLDKLYSAGCIAVSRKEWPKFKAHLLDYMKRSGPMSITVNPDGTAYIGPKGSEPTTSVADVTKDFPKLPQGVDPKEAMELDKKLPKDLNPEIVKYYKEKMSIEDRRLFLDRIEQNPEILKELNGLAESHIATKKNDIDKEKSAKVLTEAVKEIPPIVAAGKALQELGLRVSEHPEFGGVEPVHKGRAHYENRAFDLNVGKGMVEARDKTFGPIFDKVAGWARDNGYKVIWRSAGHDNHIHVEAPKDMKNRTPFTRDDMKKLIDKFTPEEKSAWKKQMGVDLDEYVKQEVVKINQEVKKETQAPDGYYIGFRGIGRQIDEASFNEMARRRGLTPKLFNRDQVEDAKKFIRENKVSKFETLGFSAGVHSQNRLAVELQKEGLPLPSKATSVGQYAPERRDVPTNAGVPTENYADNSGRALRGNPNVNFIGGGHMPSSNDPGILAKINKIEQDREEEAKRQQALSAAATPTREQTDVGSTKLEPVTPDKPDPVPAKYAGGEVQTRGDTATVINDKGEPIARINPDKERISLTETGNLDVQPTYRTDPRTLEQQNAQRQEVGNMNIDDRMQEMSTNIMNQVRQMIPQGGNPNWESMMTSMAAARSLSESPSYTFSNESFRRAMAGARFEKTGDSALGGHFEIANSNLT